MRNALTGMMIAVLVILWGGVADAQKMATPDEAKANVKKAVAFYNAVGKDKAFEEFNKPDGKFTNLKKGIYIAVYDFNGKCHASGAVPAMVGKDLLGMKDADGKPIIRDGISIAKKGSGWINYRWGNPTNKKTERKTTYVVGVDNEYMISCGAYLK